MWVPVDIQLQKRKGPLQLTLLIVSKAPVYMVSC